MISRDHASDVESDGAYEDEESDGEQNNSGDDASQASPISAHNGPPTESERFQAAESEGRTRAIQPHNTQPNRNARNTRHDDFTYTAFDFIRRTIGVRVPDREFVHAYVTAQMSAKKGLKVFGNKALTRC